MKNALMSLAVFFAFAVVNLRAVPALTIENIVVSGADSASGNITVSADVNNGTGYTFAHFQATSADGLNRRYFYPSDVVEGKWSDSNWNPYFTGVFKVDITAVDVPMALSKMYGPQTATASVTVTVTRAVSGKVNSIKYLSDEISVADYDPDGTWVDVSLAKVKLHDIGLNMDPSGVGSIGCNLLNVTNITGEMTPEEEDIAYTDTARYQPSGTHYRFNVSLHARPRGFMGMGEIKRWIWMPDDAANPSGAGRLEIDITSCSPWRSSYSTNLNSHVGFAPLFAEDEEMPEGTIMCTTAHYMDVGPTSTMSQAESVGENADGRLGLYVKGHTATESYLKMFLSDAFLISQGFTNVYDATNMLAGFVQHFDTNNVPLDSPVQVTASFTRIEGGTNVLYDYDGDGVGEAGFEMRFDFEFHSGVAGMMGMKTSASAVEGDFDNDGAADPYTVIGSNWYIWFSSAGYQLAGGPFNFGMEGMSVAADFDNDGSADPAVVVGPLWYIWFSSLGYQLGGGPFNLGVEGTPVAGDFDNDGSADPAVVVGPLWYIRFSSLGYQLGGGPFNLGVEGTPVAGDFDGDGSADPAVVSANGGLWYIYFSSAGYQLAGGPWKFNVEGAPMVGDFDGDGSADPAVVVNNNWIFLMSSHGYAPQGPFPFVP
ncbi:MAG: VCBS repeat-containing protein [Kiritimatiellae bacterium]|nr:VCBS repeat-containing protein [Kiritimatiellia bacterium]